MFYEEALIDGVLMFRDSEDGEWQQYSLANISNLINKRDKLIKALRVEVAGENIKGLGSK